VIIGLGVALFIAHLINPDLVPAIGTLLPLGFGMGPGIAYTIGQSWEAYGFSGGGSMGLTVAAIGFLVAYGHGVLIVNRGLRQGQGQFVQSAQQVDWDVRTGFVKNTEPAIGSRMTLLPGAIEPLTFHVAMIGGIYLLTYGLLTLAAMGLERIGMTQEVATLWSFLFVFANVIALGVRKVLDARSLAYLLDEGLLHRTTGLLADVLIATSIMAISLTITWDYLAPILAMCFIGTLVTYASIKWVGARVFTDYPFERFVGIYGEMTGTISSGLALVRVTDPEYRTPIAQDLVLGSGMALVMGFPLLLIINLPFTAFDGALLGYWVVLGLAAAYLLFILAVWTRYGLRFKTGG
jgi:ESS family glutamate:Na+ symporter